MYLGILISICLLFRLLTLPSANFQTDVQLWEVTVVCLQVDNLYALEYPDRTSSLSSRIQKQTTYALGYK
jgi:hypothetical protein